MKNEITTGLLLKTVVTYDENSIELKKEKNYTENMRTKEEKYEK